MNFACPCRGSTGDELDEVPPLPNHVPNFVSIFKDQPHPTSTSPPNKNKDIFKPRFPVRGNSSVSTDGEIATDKISGINEFRNGLRNLTLTNAFFLTGVEILGYHNVGTIYMKGYIPSKKPSFTGVLTPNSNTFSPSFINAAHTQENPKNFGTFIAPKSGFTAELNRINGSCTEADSEEFLMVRRNFVSTP